MQQTVARVTAAQRMGAATRRRRVPRSRPPKLIESDYAGRLVAIVGRMREAARHIVADLPAILRTDVDDARLDDNRARRGPMVVERARAEVEQTFNPTQFEGLAADIGRRVAEHHRDDLARQSRAALGVDVVVRDPRMPALLAGFIHENVALIKSLQGRTLDELEKIVTRAYANGTGVEAVQEELTARFGIAERHARMIARDQIGKLTGQVAESRHREIGIASFEWISRLDPKVRPRHRELHGKRFRYDKPPAEGLPGHPVACRCLQQPVFDDLAAAVDPQRGPLRPVPVAPGGFRIGVSSEVGTGSAISAAPPETGRAQPVPRSPTPAPAAKITAPTALPGDPFRTPAPLPATRPSSKPAPVGFEAIEHGDQTYYRHVINGRAYTSSDMAARASPAYAVELGGPNVARAGFETLEVKTPAMAAGEIRYRSKTSGVSYTAEMLESGEAAAQEAFLAVPRKERRPGLLGRIFGKLLGRSNGR